jgi:Protein of unknown function (DUF2637)
MSAAISRADRWIRRTTIGCVGLLALIAATVSYLHMHELVALYGQPGWVAALTPLSVDGMIVAASTTLLADSRRGCRGGVLPWVLLAVGSLASLSANVAVAEPTATGRVIAAWPSFALICSYELLMRQVRAAAGAPAAVKSAARSAAAAPTRSAAAAGRSPSPIAGSSRGAELRQQAWEWALTNRGEDGSLPSGKAIADRFGRHERWGRLVKRYGAAGEADVFVEHAA